LRKKEYCYGHLIWMYNDCWPETGWTTVDYYLTRKISFYFVKRAFAPIKILLQVAEDSKINTIVHNESDRALSFVVHYGYASFDATELKGAEKTIEIAPHTRKFSFNFDVGDLINGYAYVVPINADNVDVATTVKGYYRDHPLSVANLIVTEINEDCADLIVTIMADKYTPIAYLSFNDDRIKLSDNYFELLPCVPKKVRVINGKGHTFKLTSLAIDRA